MFILFISLISIEKVTNGRYIHPIMTVYNDKVWLSVIVKL